MSLDSVSVLESVSDEELRLLGSNYSRHMIKLSMPPDVPRGIVPTDRDVARDYYLPCFTTLYQQLSLKYSGTPPRIYINAFKPAGWSQKDCEEFLSTLLPDYIAYLDKSGYFVENTYQLRHRKWLCEAITILREIGPDLDIDQNRDRLPRNIKEKAASIRLFA